VSQPVRTLAALHTGTDHRRGSRAFAVLMALVSAVIWVLNVWGVYIGAVEGRLLRLPTMAYLGPWLVFSVFLSAVATRLWVEAFRGDGGEQAVRRGWPRLLVLLAGPLSLVLVGVGAWGLLTSSYGLGAVTIILGGVAAVVASLLLRETSNRPAG